MFDVGFWEIVLIFVIMLIVVGPERLPQVIRTAGLWIGKARSMVSSVRAEVERELNIDELRRSVMEQTDSDEFRKLADQVKEINSDLRSAGHELRSSLENATNQVADTINSAQQSLDLPSPEESHPGEAGAALHSEVSETADVSAEQSTASATSVTPESAKTEKSSPASNSAAEAETGSASASEAHPSRAGSGTG